MIYQLPNGKIIEITIEQYLDMTDADIDYLVSTGYGENTPRNPFKGSVIMDNAKEKSFYNDLDYSVEDDSIIPNSKDASVPEEPCEDPENDDEGDIIG